MPEAQTPKASYPVDTTYAWAPRGVLTPRTADLLATARQQLGLGVRQAARQIGITHPFLSRLERGLRRPSLAVATRIADTYRLTDGERLALMAEAAPNWAERRRQPV